MWTYVKCKCKKGYIHTYRNEQSDSKEQLETHQRKKSVRE